MSRAALVAFVFGSASLTALGLDVRRSKCAAASALGVLKPEKAKRCTAEVSKEDYHAWEAEIIRSFYVNATPTTKLIPTDACPSFLERKKVILVVLGSADMPDRVARNASDLPRKRDLMAYHMASERLQAVSHGLEGGGVFKYAACDVGGLTKYRQTAGQRAAGFLGEPHTIGPSTDLDQYAARLNKEWRDLAQKDLPASLKE